MYPHRVRRIAALLAVALLTASLTAPTLAFDVGEDHTTEPLPAEIMPLAAESILLNVARTDKHFVAVGDRGHILRSPHGENWQQVRSPVRRMLNRVRRDAAGQLWSVGYDAAILTGGTDGENWQVRHFDAEAQPLYDIEFIDADTAIAVGGRSLVLRTTDGGANWEYIEQDVFDLQFHLFSIDRLGDGTLLITAEKGLLARSTDDGESWEMLAPAYTGSFFGAHPLGEKGALIHGLRGHAYVLEDIHEVETEDPLNWDEFEAVTVTDPEELEDLGYRQVATGTLQGLFGATGAPNGGVILVGVNGTLLHSNAAVTAFEELTNPNPYTLNHALVDGNRLLAVGRQGATWIPLR